MPDHLSANAIQNAVRKSRFGCRVHHFENTDSTMNQAAKLAAEGAPHGTLVVAEEQTAGRGRHGHSWISEPSVGLYFTLIVRPELSPQAAPILTLLAGVTVAEVLQEISRIPMDLRWPNDVMCNGKKCAGILVEMNAQQDKIEHVLFGIGINVNHERVSADLAQEATSLRIETGCELSRLEVLATVLARLEHYYNQLLKEGNEIVVNRFHEISSYARGMRVKVHDGVNGLAGVTAGLTPEGVLLVRRDDGCIEKVLSGHVRPE